LGFLLVNLVKKRAQTEPDNRLSFQQMAKENRALVSCELIKFVSVVGKKNNKKTG